MGMKPKIQFRAIEFCDDYIVGTDGSVWSRKKGPWKQLAVTPDKDGYRIVSCWKAGENPKALRVHRLVLEAFIGPCPPGMECRHKDGDNTNNKLNNLCWGTPKENASDRRLHGTHLKGDSHPRSRINQETIGRIASRCALGESPTAIARVFGVAESTVRRIAQGRQRVA
jgi:hypothetical protein